MSKTLTVRLKGGLGNQIFQYAAARGIAVKNNASLCLDTYTGFASDPFARRFRLSHFDIRGDVLSEKECRSRLAKSLLACKLRSYRERCFIRSGRAYDPFTMRVRPGHNVVLEGYWQSERYFCNISNLLRQELRPTADLSSESTSIMSRIREQGGVAVHVRRLHGVSANGKKVEGRYGGNASTMSISEYYGRSIEHIRRLRGDVSAFVFADSPDWARENMKLGCPTTYVSHNGPERDYEDLLLMATCRDHVIANSSFSWWGAWLGQAPDKIVCAPRNFSPYQNGRPLRDVYPPSWAVI